jgi:pimeloyl-ACP methyl ester carboxylesterase
MQPRFKILLLGLLAALSATSVAAQDHFFDSAGIPIRFVDVGGSGEPVVLVHGYTDNLDHSWVEPGILANLAKDHRVVAFDLRGHGKSGKPHDPSQYGRQLSQDVVRLMDHLGIARAHIVGYSLGANTVAKLLTTDPQRFITATLGGGSGRRNWNEQMARDADAAADELEHGVPYRSLIRQIWPKDQPPPSDTEILQRSREYTSRNDPLAHAALLRARREEAVTDAQMIAVRVPTMAIIGSADGNLADVRALSALWSALKVVVVEGATHAGDRGTTKRPEFIGAMRAFIAAHAMPTVH